MQQQGRSVAVIGAGPAGLMAAERLARDGLAVTVYDQMPTPARKLLMAGRGGLNLTHGEPLPRFLARYGPASPRLAPAIAAFPPTELVAWSEGLGQPTFTGTSGRIFPRTMKASPLLRAWLRRLAGLGVAFRFRHRWTGWDAAGRLEFAISPGDITLAVSPAATLMALGGASWPRLGSNGAWVSPFAAAGITLTPLAPANCGVLISWSEPFRRFEGQPLKRIAVSAGEMHARGEAVVTAHGLEGGAVYAVSAAVRDALARGGTAELAVDLRPDLDAAALAARLSVPHGKQSMSNVLRKAAGLSPVAVGLLREMGRGALPADPQTLAGAIKNVRLQIRAAAGLERAISTAGGVAFSALDEHYMLRARPGVFVAGEMLDWEAPTGGYLLQATFATAVAAAAGLKIWLDGSTPALPETAGVHTIGNQPE